LIVSQRYGSWAAGSKPESPTVAAMGCPLAGDSTLRTSWSSWSDTYRAKWAPDIL
jgi:hypothetical protein